MTARGSLFGLFAVLALGSCVHMVETVVPLGGAEAPACRTALGAYRLPKALVSVSVTATPASSGGGRIEFNADAFKPTITPDNAHSFCLDYLAEPNADDIITVQRTADGLLTSVASDAIDRTPEIANKLIDTGANLAVFAIRSGQAPSTQQTLNIDFDPFDPEESNSANRALRRYGYCVYVEGYSLPEGASPAQWCDKTNKPIFGRDLWEAAQQPPVAQAPLTEVLYRANQTFKMVVMRKTDPFGPGRWELFLSRGMAMPNLSPIFGVGVERALFAQRKTSLTFEKGVLNDVKVSKGSELLGFVSIPLFLAQTLVDIPAKAIQLRINLTEQKSDLINAQSQLIQAWTNYNIAAGLNPQAALALAGVEATRSGTVGEAAGGGTARALARSAAVAHPKSSMLGACMDGGGTADQCAELARKELLK